MLHIVNKSPFEKSSLDTCLRLAQDGSVLLLIEDGVYAARKGTAVEARIRKALGRHRVCALGPDLGARGIDVAELVAGIEVVDYGGFVDLAVAEHPVQSWF